MRMIVVCGPRRRIVEGPRYSGNDSEIIRFQFQLKNGDFPSALSAFCVFPIATNCIHSVFNAHGDWAERLPNPLQLMQES